MKIDFDPDEMKLVVDDSTYKLIDKHHYEELREENDSCPECSVCGDFIMESEEEVSLHSRCVSDGLEDEHRNPCKDNPSCPDEYEKVTNNFSVCVECFPYLSQYAETKK